MKLIVTIVDAVDVDRVITGLIEQRISVTHISSTAGFLDPGNSTLLIGIDEKDVPQTIKTITDLAHLRPHFVPATYNGSVIPMGYAEIQVGGFQTFVLNVEHFEQV